MNKKFWNRSFESRLSSNPKSKIQNLKWLELSVIAFALVVAGAVAQAQQAKSVRRIGFLGAAFPSSNPARHEALRQGLRELGWIEGKSITIEYRFAGGKRERLGELARELVNLKVDVIVTGGPAPTRAVKEAEITIPVVMGFDNDPVGSGFVASLGRPTGNITGLSSFVRELNAKRLELLKEAIPKVTRVAVLSSSHNLKAAKQIGLTILPNVLVRADKVIK